MISVDIANQQTLVPVDEARLKNAVRCILADAPLQSARISLAVVDDATIRRLHREFLDEDSPTDVMSFALEQSETSLEGEVVVSAETAARTAPDYGWAAEDELLLYAIHGTLHLAGFDDTTDQCRADMRQQEQLVLSRFGVEVPALQKRVSQIPTGESERP